MRHVSTFSIHASTWITITTYFSIFTGSSPSGVYRVDSIHSHTATFVARQFHLVLIHFRSFFIEDTDFSNLTSGLSAVYNSVHTFLRILSSDIHAHALPKEVLYNLAENSFEESPWCNEYHLLQLNICIAHLAELRRIIGTLCSQSIGPYWFLRGLVGSDNSRFIWDHISSFFFALLYANPKCWLSWTYLINDLFCLHLKNAKECPFSAKRTVYSNLWEGHHKQWCWYFQLLDLHHNYELFHLLSASIPISHQWFPLHFGSETSKLQHFLMLDSILGAETRCSGGTSCGRMLFAEKLRWLSISTGTMLLLEVNQKRLPILHFLSLIF